MELGEIDLDSITIKVEVQEESQELGESIGSNSCSTLVKKSDELRQQVHSKPVPPQPKPVPRPQQQFQPLSSERIRPADRPTKCTEPDCSAQFASRRALTVHVKRFHKPRSCKVCGLEFEFREDMILHCKLHKHIQTERKTGNMQVELTAAQQEPVTTEVRTPTSATNSMPTTIKCTECPNLFTTLRAMQSHVSTVHGKHQCSVCGVDFPKREYLRLHSELHVPPRQRSHSERRSSSTALPTKCPKCSKQFTSRKGVREHLRKFCKLKHNSN